MNGVALAGTDPTPALLPPSGRHHRAGIAQPDADHRLSTVVRTRSIRIDADLEAADVAEL